MAAILIVDDDEMMCSTLSTLVERKGHKVSAAMTLQNALLAAQQQDFDIIFLDVKMPDGNGIELLEKFENCPSHPEVIIMTGYGDPNGAELAIKSGAWDYIEKGFSIKEISLSLQRALQYRQEKREVEKNVKKTPLERDEIIGNSVRLNECLNLVAQSADSDATVFIHGETGTGKEIFARAIHNNSRRRHEPFVVVDCTSLPETLVESLLFGHEKGTFTGADHARQGLILQANKGTLFLDEIGELPLTLQKAFLRVLQEHRFRPLGSHREYSSEFRLIAATNRDLDAMVQDELFRSDLLYRIKSIVIELPPLRERKDDIIALTRHYVDHFCDRYKLAKKDFSPDFLEVLSLYPWPGNIRELVNTLERIIAMASQDTTLYPKHLPNHIRAQVRRSQLEQQNASSPVHFAIPADGGDLPPLQDFRDMAVAQAEQLYLMQLLDVTRNNISQACKISGLSQSRLYALLKKYQISRKTH